MASREMYAAGAVAVCLVFGGVVAAGGLFVLPMLTGGSGDGGTATAGNQSTTTTATTETTTTVASTTTTGSSGGDGTATTTAATTTTTSAGSPSFSFTIDRIEKCGTTCRDVTATLVNEGSGPAEDVTVTVTVYADGDQLWQGDADPGTMPAGDSFSTTKRVDVGLGGAAAIQSNDGYVTIETVIAWDGGSKTFRNREKVA